MISADMLDADITIIGAGIHGAAIANEASAQGYKVLLLEQYDKPAQGTSSKSSKLIHGGLRYLESFDFKLVHECLLERKRLLKYFPDLVKLEKFYIPIYKTTSRSQFIIRLGLSLYALLGGLKKYNRFKKIHKTIWSQLDGLDTKNLIAVYQYYDAQTDDEKLTSKLIEQAITKGTKVLYNTQFTGCEAFENIVTLNYQQLNTKQTINTQYLINAAGPWVNMIADLCHPQFNKIAIDLVQGTHIEINGQLNSGIYYLEAPQDQRAVFAIPWKHHILLGTTEKIYHGDPAKCAPTSDEINYLLEVYNHYFPEKIKSSIDIIDAWAGLRVLPKSNNSIFQRSRETTFTPNRLERPNIYTIYGGKLTSHHATAVTLLKLLKS